MKRLRPEHARNPDPDPPPLWVLQVGSTSRSPLGQPERAAVSIYLELARVGLDHKVVVRDGSYAGEQALILNDGDCVDEVLAAFLRSRGRGSQLERWTPQPDARGRVDRPHAVDTPAFIRAWFYAAVAAGEVVIPTMLPSPETRRRLRESAGLSRVQVAEKLGVSRETIRLWETAEREPEGDNRDRYVEVLAAWRQEPAVKRDLDEMPAAVDPGAFMYDDLRRAQAANPLPVVIGHTWY